jgi:glycosyltransferase involved in cell wall biosynthesis
MNRVLLIPSSDYVGHPFPQRHNHIFERISSRGLFEVHVVRFNLFDGTRLATSTKIHVPWNFGLKPVSLYYLSNMAIHSAFLHRIVRNERIDVVVLSNLSPSFIYQLLGNESVPVLFDLQDHFPTSAAGYITKPSSFTGKAVASGLQGMLRVLLKGCSKTTVASHALLEYAKSLGARDVAYLPNGVGDEFLNVADGTEVRERFNLREGEVVVAYIGSLCFWINLLPLLDSLKTAWRHGIPMKLLLVGGNLHGDYVSTVRRQIRDRGLDDLVTFTGFVPYAEVPRYIAAADLCVLPFDVCNPTGYYAGPNKIWEYLSQGKPVLAAPIPEALVWAEFLEIADSADAYLDVLQGFYRDPTPFLEKANRGRQLARRMTWENSARMMEESLQETLGN